MTKADLEKLNLEMARFLVRLCRDSDLHYHGYRTPHVDKNYRRAMRLAGRAGIKFKSRFSGAVTQDMRGNEK